MTRITVSCPQCGTRLSVPQSVIGHKGRCPKCQSVFAAGGATTVASTPQATPQPSAPAAPPPQRDPTLLPPLPPSAPATSGPTASVEDIPEFMKANRRIAGKECPHCQAVLDLGDDAFNCRDCGTSMHAACHSAAGGCANPLCPKSVTARASAVTLDNRPPSEAPAAPPDEKPCRFCGERIKNDARKCRFCNEFQSAADRAPSAPALAPADNKLSTGEILVGILCGGIGCIAGIVFLVQGKKKGWKLILLSILSQLIFFIIREAFKDQ